MKILHSLVLLGFIAGCSSVKYANRQYPSDLDEIQRRNSSARRAAGEIKELWRKEVENYVFIFKPDPEVPAPGQTVGLELAVFEKRGGELAPVSKASVGGRAHMPDFSGHVHFSESHLACAEISPGVYRGSFVFSKDRDWEADFNVILPNGKSMGIDFPVRVRRAGY